MRLKSTLVLSSLLLITACAGTPERATKPPSPAAERFNESAFNLGLSIRWRDDGDGLKEEGEWIGLEGVSPQARWEKGQPSDFLKKLTEKIDWMSEHRGTWLSQLTAKPISEKEVAKTRRLLVQNGSTESRQNYRRLLRDRELSSHQETLIEIDFSTLSAPDQQAVRILLDEVLPYVEWIYLSQMDPKNLRYREEIIEQGDPQDLLAFHRLGGVQCLGEGVDPICSAPPSSPPPPPNQGFWPADFTSEDLGRLFESVENSELQDLKSPFVFRQENQGKLAWRSLNAYPPTELARHKLIDGLRKVAAVRGVSPTLRRFVKIRAKELEEPKSAYPFFEGDIAWIETGGDWELTLGYYEEYHSPFNMTAIMEAFLGVVDHDKEKQGQAFRELLPWMEESIAGNLGSPYRQRNFKDLPPLRFINTIAAGDGRARYLTIAYYLPNIPPYGKSGLSKKVILLNNSEARLEGVVRRMAELTLDPAQVKRLNGDGLDLLIIGHENAHGAGPGRQYLVRVERGKKLTAHDLLREHSSPLEEARADMVGLASLPEAVRRGVATQAQAEEAAIALLALLNRGLVMGENDDHGRGSFVQFTTLFEKGGIVETPQGYFAVDFDRIFEVARETGERMNRIQLTGDYAEFDEWYRHSVENLPTRMRKHFLPLLKKLPREFSPYYRFKFSTR